MEVEYTGRSRPYEDDARVRSDALRARFDSRGPLRLDGAMGTELEARGVECSLPLWSARALIEAPELVGRIHREYVDAGAEVLTANTFRTQPYTLRRAGWTDRIETLTARAVALAREASARAAHPIWVAGSAPPLEDCYRPDLCPDDETLAREHSLHVGALVEAGVDLLLVETHHTIREACAAATAAAATGLPWIVSFVSWEPGRLLSGESLRAAVDAVAVDGPLAVGVNCLPTSAVADAIEVLAAAQVPFGIYPNHTPEFGAPDRGDRSEPLAPEAFATLAAEWVERGARFVGGCCGVGPEAIRAMTQRL